MKEIRPGVWMIYGENGGRFPFAHSLYLQGRRSILIDTGAGKALQQLRGKAEQVYLSHYHRDHVAANSLFEGIPFWIHASDAPGVVSAEGFYRLSGLDQIGDSPYWERAKQDGFTATPVTGELRGGEKVDLGGLTLHVLHTPGHTPGHCSFFIEEYAIVFTADVDLTSFGPWYGNTTSDLEQFRESIEKIRSLQAAVVLTGHSRPVMDNVDQRLKAYAAVIEQRSELIYSLLRREALTLEQLIDRKPIYGRHPEPVQIFRLFEGNMVRQHLAALEKRGLVECREGCLLYEAR